MIILIYGEDTYRSRKHLNTLVSNFKEKHDPQGLNLSKIDGSNLTFENLSKEFSSIPFLAKKRMVVVENFLEKNLKLENSKENIEHLLKIEDSILVFYEPLKEKELKKNEIFKILSKKKKDVFLYPYSSLKIFEVKKWINDEVKKMGFNIDFNAVNLLSESIGSDLWRISSEVQKLCAYCMDKKTIKESDVRLFLTDKVEENIFKLTDALGDKNKKNSLKIFHELESLNTAPEYILTMLARHFRILIQTKDFTRDSNYITKDDVAKKLKLHPFVASKSLMQAKKFELLELKKIYKNILDIDIKLKTSRAQSTLMFDLLAVRL